MRASVCETVSACERVSKGVCESESVCERAKVSVCV